MDCLENSENERFFLLFLRKKSLIFEFFETKGGGEGGSFSVVSKRQNMSDFYFASIPYFMVRKKHIQAVFKYIQIINSYNSLTTYV